jgi:transcriptional regulator with AAA-type ATPase domain
MKTKCNHSMASDFQKLQTWLKNYIPYNTKEMKHMMKVVVTHTDTFGGEPNYGWVKRHEFTIHRDAAQRNITRKAKSMAGMTGVKADTFDYDSGLTIRPRGYNQVIFVDFE